MSPILTLAEVSAELSNGTCRSKVLDPGPCCALDEDARRSVLQINNRSSRRSCMMSSSLGSIFIVWIYNMVMAMVNVNTA
jgi:hypothetical protein